MDGTFSGEIGQSIHVSQKVQAHKDDSVKFDRNHQ
jgi:hypothetical protein